MRRCTAVHQPSVFQPSVPICWISAAFGRSVSATIALSAPSRTRASRSCSSRVEISRVAM
jgi:hypothetical protein